MKSNLKNCIILIVVMIGVIKPAWSSDIKVLKAYKQYISTKQDLSVSTRALYESTSPLSNNMGIKTLGAYVHIFVKNNTNDQITFKELYYNGKKFEYYLKYPPCDNIAEFSKIKPETNSASSIKDIIWWRLTPFKLKPGQVGQVIITARSHIIDWPVKVKLVTDNGLSVQAYVKAETRNIKIEDIVFSENLRNSYIYIKGSLGIDIDNINISINGSAPDKEQLASFGVVSHDNQSLRLFKYSPVQPFKKGEPVTFIVNSPGESIGCTIKAVGGFSYFGYYCGIANRETVNYYSEQEGVNSLIPFRPLSRKEVEEGLLEYATDRNFQVNVYRIEDEEKIPVEFLQNEGLGLLFAMDEPNLRDYKYGKKVGYSNSCGLHAPKILSINAIREARLPGKLNAITLDQTYLGGSYVVYGQMVDVINPDFYIRYGRFKLPAIKTCLEVAKTSVSPRPLAWATLLSHEQHIDNNKFNKRPAKDQDLCELYRSGMFFEKYNNKNKGLRRPSSVEEMRLQLLYCLGAGVKRLTPYMLANCAYCLNGRMNYHGNTLDELGQGRICEASLGILRNLRVIAKLIEISSPFDWAEASVYKNHKYNQKIKWPLCINTLIAADKAAIVVVLNENYQSRPYHEGAFTYKTAKNLKVNFADLPWLKGKKVYRLYRKRLIEQPKAKRTTSGISWPVQRVIDGDVFVVAGDDFDPEAYKR